MDLPIGVITRSQSRRHLQALLEPHGHTTHRHVRMWQELNRQKFADLLVT
ncbi:MAG: hypothetical protein WDO73_35500 [Ignavibacteriota bacterium]